MITVMPVHCYSKLETGAFKKTVNDGLLHPCGKIHNKYKLGTA